MRKLGNNGKPIDVDPYLDRLLEHLRTIPDLVALYLYGSYGTSLQTPLSDVDLAVVYRIGHVPALREELDLSAEASEILQEDDVSVTVLNRSQSPFQYRVLSTGRLLLCTDETALADFVESVLKRHGDYVIDYDRFLREYDQTLVEIYA